MSLEQMIEKLTAAVVESTAALVENTATTKELMALRSEAIESVKNAASTAGKKTAETKKAEPAKTETAAGTPDEAAYQEAKDLVKQFTTGSDRPEEQQARKAKVRELLRHKVLVKPELADNTETFSVTDVMEDKIPQLIKNLKVAIERGDITQPPTADAGDDLL